MRAKIKSHKFLNWYFCSGSDEEQGDMAKYIGMKAIKEIMKTGSYSVNVVDLWRNTNTDYIPLSFTEDYRHDDGCVCDNGVGVDDIELVLT